MHFSKGKLLLGILSVFHGLVSNCDCFDRTGKKYGPVMFKERKQNLCRNSRTGPCTRLAISLEQKESTAILRHWWFLSPSPSVSVIPLLRWIRRSLKSLSFDKHEKGKKVNTVVLPRARQRNRIVNIAIDLMVAHGNSCTPGDTEYFRRWKNILSSNLSCLFCARNVQQGQEN